MAHTLKGWTAIRYAEKHDEFDGELRKYADPTEDAREGLSVSQAKSVAREDPGLIYLRVPSGRRNPRQPHKRVRKALAKYVKGNVGLPKQWTPAQVRVNDKGQVQVKVNPDKLGSGTRFARCVKAVAEKGGAYDPKAVCASAGRKKFGAKKMASMARAGKKRAKRNTGFHKVYTAKHPARTFQVHVPATSRDSGYDLTITAKSSSNAIKQARAYCAKRAGVPTSQYHLPKATKARTA